VPWFLRLLQRFQPREGWLIFALAFLAVLCLPAQTIDANWLVGTASGLWLTTLAFLLAWRLAHARLSGWAAAGLLALAGVLADLIWGVYVLRPGPPLAEAGAHLAWWFAGRHPPAPPWIAAPAQWAALVEFVQRVGWWGAGLTGGHGFPDNLVVAGLAQLVIWAAAAWAAWWIARRGRPFEALLPGALLIATQAFMVDRGLAWLLVVISLLPLLLALERSHWLTRHWDAEGLDYSTELHLTAALAGVGVMIIVMSAMPSLPFLTSRQLADYFWQRFAQPYRKVEQRLTDSFPAAPGARSLVPAGGVASGGLPRAHLLGGRPELGKEIALRVSVRGAQPNDPLYWRGQTFAVYDGHGWKTDPGTAELASLQAGQPWAEDTLAARHTVLSFVDVYAATRAIMYAPNEPVSLDRPYQALTRGPGDLIQLQAPGQPDAYTVLSAIPDLNPNALAAAGKAYPPEIARVYLQLPENLPPQLAVYAAHVTAGAATPYDAAVAVEAALRQIPYSLDVPTPPPDRELVSWFLFDLQRGYCDYYATAMVVLARLAGIPARLAVGYAPGTVEPGTGKYRVYEAQAHSWPELYFPHLGWVPFEPTPAEPVPARVPGAVPDWLAAGGEPPPIPPSELSDLAARGAQVAAQAARARTQGLVLVALNGLVAAWTGWRLLRPGRVVTAGEQEAAYTGLLRWGARLGRPALPTDTPREYAAALAQAATTTAGRARYSPAAARQAAATVQSAAHQLALEYELAAYAGDQALLPPTPAVRPAARWRDLWAALRRLWWARLWRV
jgi:transglutaminase-like putative cysteine protease